MYGLFFVCFVGIKICPTHFYLPTSLDKMQKNSIRSLEQVWQSHAFYRAVVLNIFFGEQCADVLDSCKRTMSVNCNTKCVNFYKNLPTCTLKLKCTRRKKNSPKEMGVVHLYHFVSSRRAKWNKNYQPRTIHHKVSHKICPRNSRCRVQ